LVDHRQDCHRISIIGRIGVADELLEAELRDVLRFATLLCRLGRTAAVQSTGSGAQPDSDIFNQLVRIIPL
jgi:hypothetical protein